MLQNQIPGETSVDAKTAEMALSLAIRLQQERGERMSISELQRIADEAGIDRESLQLALEQVNSQSVESLGTVRGSPTGIAPTLVLIAVLSIALSNLYPAGSALATALRIVGGVGFAAACFLFIRFLRKQGRI